MKEAWEKQYKENSAPWNYDGFDEDFRKFLGSKFYKDFTVIDLGCGNGSQAHHIEKLGFRVTGTDVVNALEYDIEDFIIDDNIFSGASAKLRFSEWKKINERSVGKAV